MYGHAKGVSRTWRNEGTYKNLDQWRRWDEELVEQFGRWLNRLAKVFAILLLAIWTAVFTGWL
jgi:hypothetical protein